MWDRQDSPTQGTRPFNFQQTGAIVRKAVLGVTLVVAAMLFAVPVASAQSTGFLEICKNSTTIDPVSGPFAFTIDNGPTVVTVNTGGCSAPIEVAAGNHTVREAADDATAVTAADTIPADRLVSFDRAARAEVVSVPAGDVSATTTLEVTNQEQFGHLEICKAAQAGSGLTGTFTFRITGPMGFSMTTSVPVGACSNSLRVPAGAIEVDEVGANSTDLVAVSTVRSGDLLADNLVAGTSRVRILAGANIDNETIETFVNSTSRLKICKVAGSASLVGTVFSFTANGQTVQAVAEAGAGGCALVQTPFSGGTRVDIQEGITPGTGVSAIDVSNNRQVPGSVNLSSRSVSVILGSGETVVTYTNQVVSDQLLKVCKNAGAGVTVGQVFHFTVGTRSVDVPAGFCAIAGTFAFNSTVTVTEAATAGLSVIAETAAPAVNLVSVDLAARSERVLVGTGVTEVAFTNATTGTTSTVSTGNGVGATTTPAATLPVTTTTTTTGVTPTPVVEHPHSSATSCVVSARIVNRPRGGFTGRASSRLLLKLTSGKATCTVRVRGLNSRGAVVTTLRRQLRRGHQVSITLDRRVKRVRVTVVA